MGRGQVWIGLNDMFRPLSDSTPMRTGILFRAKGAELAACERGGPALEFAFVAPMTIALIVAVIHTALIFLAGQGLQSAAEAAGRLVMTGQAQGTLTQAQFQAKACAALPGFMPCAGRLFVDVQVVSSGNFADATLGAVALTYDSKGAVSNSFTFNTGGRGDIVVVRLMYLWPVVNGPFGLSLSNQPGGNRMITAASVLKTEYY